MVEKSGGNIFRINPNIILDKMSEFIENRVIASDVEIKINLNKCMTFRDDKKEDMINDGSTIIKKMELLQKKKKLILN